MDLCAGRCSFEWIWIDL